MPMRDTPAPAPTAKQLQAALAISHAVQLHFYQLLYFHDPQWTSPGHPGFPFDVEFDPQASACIRIQFTGSWFAPKNPEYWFRVQPWLLDKIEETDQMVIEKCGLILKAAEARRKKLHSGYCCPLAEARPCVCHYSFDCVLHGQTCVGTHD